jgi:signal transduction histidine kinase
VNFKIEVIKWRIKDIFTKTLSLMSPSEAVAKLKSFEIFKDVPSDQLFWFVEQSEIAEPPVDEYLWLLNASVTTTYVVLAGEIRIVRELQGQSQDFIEVEEGGVTGYLPYSRAKFAIAAGIIPKPSTILLFPKEKVPDLIHHHFELTQALVTVMTTRVKDNMERQKQNEKMMALGKLSAGLAHELNNPISAIIRSSEALQKHLQLTPASFKEVMAIKMTPEKVDVANTFLFSKISQKQTKSLTPIQRADLEDEMVEWLEQYDVQNVYDVAENLVEFNFSVGELKEFKKNIPDDGDFDPVINWVNNNLITEKTVSEIKEASSRIATLIQSVKTYTHMDRDKERQEVDIHDGIRNTLVILSYKIKKDNIKVIEKFDPTIPKASIMVGEMNQVWTNLIDNAIDGMDGIENRQLEIESRYERGKVIVNIIDNGKGIPESIKDRIFEPFFTTKEVGKGTGLGLDLVLSIIKQHKGTVKVTSVPGRTNFEVCFPIHA